MDIRITAGRVHDGNNQPYLSDSIPDPKAHAEYLAKCADLAKLPLGDIGRSGPSPKLTRGLTLKRGESMTLRGVSDEYVKLLKTDQTRTVEIIDAPAAPEKHVESEQRGGKRY